LFGDQASDDIGLGEYGDDWIIDDVGILDEDPQVEKAKKDGYVKEMGQYAISRIGFFLTGAGK
jgi:hypothetical protein